MRNFLVVAAPSTGLAGRFDRENAVLLAASHVGAPSRATPAQPLDWPYLLRAANRQGVTPLLHAWLKRRPDIVPDASSASRVHDAYWSTHFHNGLLLAELVRVRRAAAEAGVDVMALKGARLAADYYPLAALRPLGDLDLLVRPRARYRRNQVVRRRLTVAAGVSFTFATAHISSLNLEDAGEHD